MMPEFNKSVIVSFKEIIPYSAPIEMITPIVEKLDELRVKGKTNGRVDYPNDYSAQRYFVDQDSVDEWITFIKDLTSKYNFDIVDIKVIDI